VAAGRSPGAFKRRGRTPLSYLRSLQVRDGSVRYSRVSAQTPVWVTAQALDALEQKAFPLAPAPRAARAPRPSGAGGAGPAKTTKKRPQGGAPAKPAAPKPKPSTAPPAAPSPTAAGPTGPTGSSGPSPRAGAPAVTAAQRVAARMLARRGGGEGWVGIAIVAGLTALALWRLARRRARRLPEA
jgi:hypothetical protein